MSDLNPFLAGAYAIFWALTFILVISIWVRQRRLDREIKALESQLEKKESK